MDHSETETVANSVQLQNVPAMNFNLSPATATIEFQGTSNFVDKIYKNGNSVSQASGTITSLTINPNVSPDQYNPATSSTFLSNDIVTVSGPTPDKASGKFYVDMIAANHNFVRFWKA